MDIESVNDISFDGEQIRINEQRNFFVKKFKLTKDMQDCCVLDLDLYLCPELCYRDDGSTYPGSNETIVLNINVSDIGRIRLNAKRLIPPK